MILCCYKVKPKGHVLRTTSPYKGRLNVCLTMQSNQVAGQRNYMILPKNRVLAGKKFRVYRNSLSNGGTFDSYKQEIEIGSSGKPDNQFDCFLYEVCEGILALRDLRYTKEIQESDNDDYLFSFNHKEFEVFCSDLTKALEGFEYKGKK